MQMGRSLMRDGQWMEGETNAAVTKRVTMHRRRRAHVQINIPMMQSDSDNSIHEFQSEEEGSERDGHCNINSVKYQYCDET